MRPVVATKRFLSNNHHSISISSKSQTLCNTERLFTTQIQQVKLQWNAKPKIGSLDNAAYKPGGGDKKIETVKLDFKDKAKPKVGSKENAKHVPGGGTIKVCIFRIIIK